MPRYEYKVVPAPTKGLKGKGVKGPEARFSHALQELMNGLSGYGWEYQRAETLPSVERSGLTSTTTEWRNVLVFRRLRETGAEAFAPELLPPPDQTPPTPQNAAPASSAEAAEPGTIQRKMPRQTARQMRHKRPNKAPKKTAIMRITALRKPAMRRTSASA